MTALTVPQLNLIAQEKKQQVVQEHEVLSISPHPILPIPRNVYFLENEVEIYSILKRHIRGQINDSKHLRLA